MSHYTKEDIINLVEEEDVAFIRLQFTDIYGNFKNVAVTAGQLEEVLNNKCMFDGSSIVGFARIEESDMFLIPDLDTFAIFPWRPHQGKVARLICNIEKPDGDPFEGDTRKLLQDAVADAQKLGYTMQIGPECEFFLFHTDDNGYPTTESHETAGYFDMGPLDYGENARRDMVMNLEEMGFHIEASHHEGAPAQHEIDFRYDGAVETADNIQTFKMAVRTVARQHGLHATFMPKPKAGMDGSSMHINISLHKEGRNIFGDDSDPNGLSQEAYWFIGGIIKHIKGMTAVLNPIINSYKRLQPGYEAPAYIAWGTGNRTPLIRIPYSADIEHRRIELRSPDSASNPYLAIAVCLKAGLDGIKNRIVPPAPISGNVNRMTEAERSKQGIERLPNTLHQATRFLEADDFVCKVLGDHITRHMLETQKKEWAEYSSQVSAWELEKYLGRM